MSTSTPAPSRLRYAAEELVDCPAWCVADHEPGEFVHPYHEGPAFGGVTPVWSPLDLAIPAGREWGAGISMEHYWPGYVNAEELTAPELRQLAADALAAAEWLEAHR